MSFSGIEIGDAEQDRLIRGCAHQPSAAIAVAGDDAGGIEAVVDDVEHFRRKPVVFATPADAFGNANNPVGGEAVLQRRFDWKCDFAGADADGDGETAGGDCPQGGGVGIVEVEDVGPEAHETAADSENGGGVSAGTGKGDGFPLASGIDVFVKGGVYAGDDEAFVPAGFEAVDEFTGLLFSASPAGFGDEERDSESVGEGIHECGSSEWSPVRPPRAFRGEIAPRQSAENLPPDPRPGKDQ